MHVPATVAHDTGSSSTGAPHLLALLTLWPQTSPAVDLGGCASSSLATKPSQVAVIRYFCNIRLQFLRFLPSVLRAASAGMLGLVPTSGLYGGNSVVRRNFISTWHLHPAALQPYLLHTIRTLTIFRPDPNTPPTLRGVMQRLCV